MTIDGLHYIKSVIVSDNPYELTLLCDTSWEGEVFEVPATVVYQGREYTVTSIDVGQSWKTCASCEFRQLCDTSFLKRVLASNPCEK